MVLFYWKGCTLRVLPYNKLNLSYFTEASQTASKFEQLQMKTNMNQILMIQILKIIIYIRFHNPGEKFQQSQ